jgi:hypothetical protein
MALDTKFSEYDTPPSEFEKIFGEVGLGRPCSEEDAKQFTMT